MKIICYEEKNVEKLILMINKLKMPLLENAEIVAEIKKILESGKIGSMKEEGENAMEQ